MTNTIVIANSLIVVPETDLLVLTARNKVLSRFSDSKSIDLASLGSVQHSDCLAVVAVPVSDLPIAACGEHLRLIGMVEHLLEHGGLE